MPINPDGSPAIQAVISHVSERVNVQLTPKRIRNWYSEGLAPRVVGKSVPDLHVMDHYAALATMMPPPGTNKSPAIIAMAVYGFDIPDDGLRAAALNVLGEDGLEQISGDRATVDDYDAAENVSDRWMDGPGRTGIRLPTQLLAGRVRTGLRLSRELGATGGNADEPSLNDRVMRALVDIALALKGERLTDAALMLDMLGPLTLNLPTATRARLCTLLERLDYSRDRLIVSVNSEALADIVIVSRNAGLWLSSVGVSVGPTTDRVSTGVQAFCNGAWLHQWGFDTIESLVSTISDIMNPTT